MPTLRERYYSGRDVQRKLGITEPALRNLVNQKKLKKVVLLVNNMAFILGRK